MAEPSTSVENEDLPKYLKDRIEKNRQKSLALKKSKLVHHPYAKG